MNMNENTSKNKGITVYVGGDMLKLGSQIMRQREKERLAQLGFTPYAPQDDEEINDKQNQTEESNDGLAEKIFFKDTEAMLKSDILIFEVDGNNIGTTTEVGQFAMVYELAGRYPHIQELQELASKPVFFHTTDVRHTDIPEKGMRRSFSMNQYLHGACLRMNPKGIQTWNEIEEELKEIQRAHDLNGLPF